MRVAIIGANGNFGLKRLRAIQHSDDDVVALCDLQFDRALKVYNRAGVILETDYHQLRNSNFDVAVVSLPDHLKLQVVGDLLAARKHVIVEKPLSLRVADVQYLFSLARKNHVYLYVGYNMRFFPSVATLLRLTREGFFGSVHHVRMFYGHGGVHTLLNTQKWQLSASSWGGAFVDMGSHLLSIASHFIPRVESATLQRQNVISRIVEDNSVAVLKGNGCIAELTSSWTAWRSRFSMEVYGSEGFAELESLIKYIKYGQQSERIRYGRKNLSGAPKVTERAWGKSPTDSPNVEVVDDFSAEVECLDQEWRWFIGEITNGTLDMRKHEEMNNFVADVYERFYQ